MLGDVEFVVLGAALGSDSIGMNDKDTSHEKHVLAELLCSAAYGFCSEIAVGRAQPGQQRRHLFQIERSAGPLKLGSHTGVTPKQKATHVEARLQHRERSLAEVLTILVTRHRFGLRHLELVTTTSRFVFVVSDLVTLVRIHVLSTLRRQRTARAVLAAANDLQDRMVAACLVFLTESRQFFPIGQK